MMLALPAKPAPRLLNSYLYLAKSLPYPLGLGISLSHLLSTGEVLALPVEALTKLVVYAGTSGWDVGYARETAALSAEWRDVRHIWRNRWQVAGVGAKTEGPQLNPSYVNQISMASSTCKTSIPTKIPLL